MLETDIMIIFVVEYECIINNKKKKDIWQDL